MKVIVRFFAFFYIFTIALASSSEETEKLKSYVNELITDRHSILSTQSLTESEKLGHLTLLINKNLHLEWMADYTLGPHRKNLPIAKKKEFIEAYSRFVVKAYVHLLRDHNIVKVLVKKVVQVNNNVFVVSMEVFRKDSDLPLKVEYLIHKVENNKKKSYNVADIVTEGISILNSQQVEFCGIISSYGIDALIDNLKKKI